MSVHRVGVISDTHGLLRPAAAAALQGVELIVHAGDIGQRRVLEGLEEIAPVVAVHGNVDRRELVGDHPHTCVVQVDGALLYVIHDLLELDIDPAAAGFQAVIFGHSHKSLIERRDGVLFLNPGAAGPRRFKLPVSLAVLEVQGTNLDVRLITLEES
jgi:putative phosphoesterase